MTATERSLTPGGGAGACRTGMAEGGKPNRGPVHAWDCRGLACRRQGPGFRNVRTSLVGLISNVRFARLLGTL
jgi:hypothetical protein